MSQALPFIHLKVRTTYSLAEGAVRIGALVEHCLAQGVPAVGITDTNNLFGSLEISQALSKAGVQPVIGCILRLLPHDREADTSPALHTPEQLALLVQNETGYQNLMRIVSESYLSPAQEHGAPLYSYPRLKGNTDGLIALSGGPEGGIHRALKAGQPDHARALLMQLRTLFDDRLYIEIQRHGIAQEEAIEPALIDLAYQHNLPLVATNDVMFLEPEMAEAHDAFLCIAQSTTIDDPKRRRVTPEHYFKSADAMQALFEDLPEATANTAVISQRCAFMAPVRKPILPRFDTGEGRNEAEELRVAARKGLEMRLETVVYPEAERDARTRGDSDTPPALSESDRKRIAEPYFTRLEYELDIINNMEFPGYFLIVSDFIRWSKRQDIPVGPGRGSGAGSVVAWALEITDLDPLRFGLLFERFLNPERVSMPDFDVDFCQDRRDEVIRYVQDKYGHDRVAQIITFGKLQARAVLRDVGRVLGMPYGQVDKICKLVPSNPANPVTLQEAIDMEPALQEAIRAEESVQRLVDIALKLEGLYRHASTHAAGVVIGDRPLEELVALYRDPRSDMPVVQYSMKYAEMAGMVKFDFLGLKTLSVIQKACDHLKRRNIEVDISTIPLDDSKTFEMISRGDSSGVFQLESSGMRDALRKLRPDKIEDIIALVSLYRPGPMDNIPTYCARKHGEEGVEYPHPLLEPILEETYGVIIYQEQVMEIAQVLAGYSLGSADLLRRAMGKKIKAEMDAQRDSFVEGAVKNGVTKARANSIFDLVAKFAGYGFNKSHAAAYALIAYQTAWLKANYPVEFFAATLTYDMHNTDKLGFFVAEASKAGIAVLPPDINASQAEFSVELLTPQGGREEQRTTGLNSSSPPLEGGSGLAIRYALGALKNVGSEAMRTVVKDREANGPFTDMFDFAERMDTRVLNKRQLENLVRAGAFDSIVGNRRRLFESIDTLARHSQAVASEKASAQESLFGDAGEHTLAKPPLADTPDWPPGERLQHEFEAIGFYLSAHPLDAWEEQLQRLRVLYSVDFEKKLTKQFTSVRVAGIVTGKRMMVSQKGRFAFVQMSDATGDFEISIFDEALLNQARDMLENGRMLSVHADGRQDDGQVRLVATSIAPLQEALNRIPRDLEFIIESEEKLALILASLAEQGPRNGRLTLRIPLEDGREVEVVG